jgi:membrane protein implicated in regulation of membrane protease activity
MMTNQAARSRSPIAAHPLTSAAIAILMAANIFFVLYTPIYSKVTPKVGDFPFFYFYLLIFMPITSVAMWLIVRLQKRLGTPGQDQEDPPGAAATGTTGSETAR